MKEENVDAMKYRKATHLAGVDVDLMDNKIVTIKKCWYETQVNVSGNKTNGYFLSFVEDFKDMVVNSSNRKTIINIVKNTKQLPTKEARNTKSWEGLRIELYFDETVTMMGKVTGGIRIKAHAPVLPELLPNTPQWDKVVEALAGVYTMDQIKTKYSISNENEKLLSNG